MGSLAAAIVAANASPCSTITFNIPGSAPFMINLTQASELLPAITAQTTIDGTSQPGFDPNNPVPVITIEGNGLPGDGLVLGAGSDLSTIKGLTIDNFGNSGIVIRTGRNKIEDNMVSNNGGDGVVVVSPGPGTFGGNIIGGTTPGDRNIISGNKQNGIRLSSADAFNYNVILGNYIGTDATGKMAVPNQGDGVHLVGEQDDTIGEPGAANVISGNYANGIGLSTTCVQEKIQDNFIGTDASGMNAIPNLDYGIDLTRSYSTYIGGTLSGAGNVISGNTGGGINIRITGNVNYIEGNLIGTDKTGLKALPNGGDGIDLSSGLFAITIGGTTTAARNIISGNMGSGISLDLPVGIVIQGNFIGTDKTGLCALPNKGDGLDLAGTGPNPMDPSFPSLVPIPGNTIGGTATDAGNVISGNKGSGIRLTNGATKDLILGNYVGTNASGTPLPNGGDGLDLVGATNNTIGESVSGASNVFSGNSGSGISLSANANNNQILGNYIGTNANSVIALGNGSDGVDLAGVSNNIIGGTTTAARNLISGNVNNGISLSDRATYNQILGDLIGTDASGKSSLGNSTGISIDSSSNNIVGGIAAGAGNLISGNNSIGIQISNSLATNNLVEGNRIGTNADGTAVLVPPNLTTTGYTGYPIGILINDSPRNQIGGTMAGACNVISGFCVAVNISSYNASGNAIQGNRIGTAQSGKPLTNANWIGIYINEAGQNTAAGNTIMGYTEYGVYLFGSQSEGNVVQGNQIGQPVAIKELAAARPKQQLAGIAIQGASSNMIGGATRTAGNTILGNAYAGVYIFGQANSASNNRIENNLFKNNSYGILLYNAANNGQYFTLQRSNRFGKNPIADIREFTGPVPSQSKSSSKTTTSGRKDGHRDLRPAALRRQSLQSRNAGRAQKDLIGSSKQDLPAALPGHHGRAGHERDRLPVLESRGPGRARLVLGRRFLQDLFDRLGPARRAP
jgi:titin